MQEKLSEVFQAKIGRSTACVNSSRRGAVLTIGETSAGPFTGRMRWTFYAGYPFVLQGAVRAMAEG